MANVFDRQGQPVTLGAEIAKGGEGAVYEIAGRADIVAKIYHKPPTPDKAAKLSAMSMLPAERLLSIAAWPLSTVHQKLGGPVSGLLMPKVSGFKEVHTLYGPKSRMVQFPNATWPFLVHTAMNAARAFAVIHEQGLVIGDVNQSNLYVSDKSTVKLIDCDSFQIVQNGHAYLCEVGVPTHTPPELQGKPFHSVTRSANHDNFGLAVIIFQLLFMGRHPFSGQYLGPGEMSIEKAISEFRFAYGPGAASRQMKQPPATLSFAAIPNQAAWLFEQAFSPSGTQPGGRPRAQDWVGVLSNVAKETQTCNRNKGHQYLKTLAECPWCEIETKLGIALFKAVIVGTAQFRTAYDIEAVWVQILAVPHPGPLPAVAMLPSFSTPPMLSFQALPPLMEPSAKVALSGKMQNISRKRTARRWIVAGIVAIVGLLSTSTGSLLAIFYLILMAFVVSYTLIILLFNRSVQSQIDELMQSAMEEYQFAVASREVEEREQRQRERNYQEKRHNIEQSLNLAETRNMAMRQQWENEASSQVFDTRLAELKEAKNQLQDLNQTLLQRLQKLESDGARRQLEKYLDRFKLQSASIDGIGPGRKATLQSYGIETAADISEIFIQSIPGFGQSLCGALMTWRRTHEQKFVYNANLGVDPADKAALEQQFSPRSMKIEQELNNGPASLHMLRQQILDKRRVLQPKLEEATQSVVSGRSNLQSLSL